MSASKGNSFCTKMTVKNWWSSLCTSYRWSHEALLLQCSTHITAPLGNQSHFSQRLPTLQAPYNTSTSSQLQMSLSSTNHYHHAQFLISFIKSVCLLPRQFLAQNVFFSVEWCWSMVFQVRINKNCWRMSKKIGVLFQCFKCSKILIMFRKCL